MNMCSEQEGVQLPKEFERTTEVLPLRNYGISTYEEFKRAEDEMHHHECLKRAGLTNVEIKLYEDHEAGISDDWKKVEANVLKDKVRTVYEKIENYKALESSVQNNEPSASTSKHDIFEKLQKPHLTFYPEGHPMNQIKEIEENLFGHLKNNDILPVTKRRKILRRLERKKLRIMSQEHQLVTTVTNLSRDHKPGSLWDVKELPLKIKKKPEHIERKKDFIGPHRPTMYTVKDNKIVRLEPVESNKNNIQDSKERKESKKGQEYQAVDILLPINKAEKKLLEGTKMSLENIKKIERFKDYQPGIPSKVLYLKNINSSVTQEQISLLFNQFAHDNGGPIDVRLLSGRMRGQAFVTFHDESLAIRALEEVNGTILGGRPIVIQFGRNSNRIQDSNR